MTIEDLSPEALSALHLDTLAIRSGISRSHEGEHSEALFLTSSYVFDSAAQAAARFSGEAPGNVYSRYTNPTVRGFEQRLAALEQAESAVATASGMAAILGVCMALLQSGDHIICSRSVFGTTTVLFAQYMGKFGVEVDFVDLTNHDQWQQAIKPNTRFLYLETPSNPLCQVADIARMSELAQANDCLLVIDNCFCTPALQKPMLMGADLVIHSATKYLDGQGRCLGGVVVGPKTLTDKVLGFIRTCGATMSPFNAWVFTKSLETLSLRMNAHSSNALALATWLSEQDKIEQVFYAGLPNHIGHDLATKQQSAYGGVLSFRVKGGREQAWKLIDSTQIMSLTANLGDTKTTIVHPATTTHGRLSDEDKKAAGITENLIRIAVGLEHISDLQDDLARGLSVL